MTKITTHKGDTLLLVEVPLDAMDLEVVSNLQDNSHNNLIYSVNILDEMAFVELPNNEYELIGTTLTLTELQASDLVEGSTFNNKLHGHIFDKSGYHTRYKDKFRMWTLYSALESFHSLLKANNIDTKKNWVVLKVKND